MDLLLALVAVAAVAALAGAVLFVRDPVGVLRWFQRQAMNVVLGRPEQVATPRGPVRFWRGGEGPHTLVLVHGFGDAGPGWVEVARRLRGEARLVIPDLPGHGQSAPGEAPLPFEDVEAGFEAVVDAIDGPVALVGNSLGGWLVLRYALAHPERVQAVVPVNSAGMPQAIDPGFLMPKTREMVRAKNETVMGDQVPRLPGFVLDGFAREAQDPRLRSLYESTKGHHFHGELADLQVPVHVIWGTPDGFFPVEGYLDRLRDELPDHELTMIPGKGHSPQYSDPDRVAEVLRGILGGLPA